MSKKESKLKKTLQKLAKKAEIHPMLPTKYNAFERKKLREFEQSLFPTDEDKRKLAEAVEGKHDESSRVIMSPVFSTPEQERIFAEAAKKSMSITAELEWDGKAELVSVFHTEEQEKEFSKIAEERMDGKARLKWQDESEEKSILGESSMPQREESYKVLKNLRPNTEYAELLKSVALKISALEEPISPEMVEQIKELSKSIIKQGEKEKNEYENNKKDISLRAMHIEKQECEENKEEK